MIEMLNLLVETLYDNFYIEKNISYVEYDIIQNDLIFNSYYLRNGGNKKIGTWYKDKIKYI